MIVKAIGGFLLLLLLFSGMRMRRRRAVGVRSRLRWGRYRLYYTRLRSAAALPSRFWLIGGIFRSVAPLNASVLLFIGNFIPCLTVIIKIVQKKMHLA